MVNKKYILFPDTPISGPDDEIIDIALSFPDEDLIQYLLKNNLDIELSKKIETLIRTNSVFRQRVEGTKIFIEANNITTITEYYSVEENEAKQFADDALDTLLSLNKEDIEYRGMIAKAEVNEVKAMAKSILKSPCLQEQIAKQQEIENEKAVEELKQQLEIKYSRVVGNKVGKIIFSEKIKVKNKKGKLPLTDPWNILQPDDISSGKDLKLGCPSTSLFNSIGYRFIRFIPGNSFDDETHGFLAIMDPLNVSGINISGTLVQANEAKAKK